MKSDTQVCVPTPTGVPFAKNATELVKLMNFTLMQRDSMGGGVMSAVISLCLNKD